MAIAAAIFGAIVGSFLNALLFRWGTGVSVARGRSKCMHCGHALGFIDLVPVFSFLWLRGRCRYCSSAISWQYPAVECAAAVLSVGVYLSRPDPAGYAALMLVWTALIFIAVYDLRHHIIPPSASVFLALVTCTLAAASTAYPLCALAAGPILALPLFLLSLFSGGRAMGWADSGLELSLGWLLGLTAGLTALMLAFWIGAAVGILLSLVSKKVTMKSEVPFAPFLIAGAACAYFLHVDFFTTLPLLFS